MPVGVGGLCVGQAGAVHSAVRLADPLRQLAALGWADSAGTCEQRLAAGQAACRTLEASWTAIDQAEGARGLLAGLEESVAQKLGLVALRVSVRAHDAFEVAEQVDSGRAECSLRLRARAVRADGERSAGVGERGERGVEHGHPSRPTEAARKRVGILVAAQSAACERVLKLKDNQRRREVYSHIAHGRGGAGAACISKPHHTADRRRENSAHFQRALLS
mmetsp:Transcript_10901/g.36123  ORF Transcript_10901/g.36123 Transcript_10901/m.36123 type:complete len:220 (-) Transcript_10901:231-890(-)